MDIGVEKKANDLLALFLQSLVGIGGTIRTADV
jgi:hypothetical protein